jgi:glutaredoxin 3
LTDVTLYTKRDCSCSQRARTVLRRKAVSFHDIDITGDEACRREMEQRAGGERTTPQIFIDGQHIGGCEELLDLEERGALDWLLSGRDSGEASPS